MSKGSSYWSTARGKIGNTVVSVVRGQRIERAYQPSVNNPRTPSQMRQRAKFFSAVGFYKQATSGLFKFAFEDKRQTESDYNSFMRYNVASAPMYSKKTLGSETRYVPFLNSWVLSNGSLPELRPVATDESQYRLPLNNTAYRTPITTIKDFSEALVGNGQGFQYGDIITFVKYVTSANVISADDGFEKDPIVLLADLENVPHMEIKQFALSASDTTPVGSYWMNANAGAPEEGNSASVSFTFDDFGLPGDNADYYLAAFAVIVSRPGASLKVSPSQLVPTTYTAEMMEVYGTDEWQQGVLKQWQTGEEAILEGALV